MTIDQLLDHVSASLDVDLEEASPAQLAELSGILISTLANISQRTQNAEHKRIVRWAIRSMIDQVKLEIHDSDPGDCERIVRVCAAIDFQSRVTAALTEARKAKQTED